MKPLRRGIELGDRRDDAHVRIAVLQVPAAQQVAVGLDAVRIVQIVVLEEAQDVRSAPVLITSRRRQVE